MTFSNGQLVRIADVNTVHRNMVGVLGTFQDGFVKVLGTSDELAGPYDDDELESVPDILWTAYSVNLNTSSEAYLEARVAAEKPQHTDRPFRVVEYTNQYGRRVFRVEIGYYDIEG